MNVSDTQYSVVKFVGKKIMNWVLDYTPLEDYNFDICWTDNSVKPSTLSKMQPHQKINHFPGRIIKMQECLFYQERIILEKI